MNTASTRHPRTQATLTALATASLTLALLAGMPYILWTAIGIPQPPHIHSWTDLAARITQPVTEPLMLDLLGLAGWICWLAFTHSILREALWYTTHLPNLLRDRAAHRAHLATLSPRNTLAALCIGTLVVALLSLWRPHPATAQTTVDTENLSARLAATAPHHPHTTTAPHSGSSSDRGSSSRPEDHTTSAPASPTTSYTVAEGDTLWDIAAEKLGDPLLWPRIYALTKDQPQPDGQRLTHPDHLQPGWQLTLPVPDTTPTTPPAEPTPDSSAEADQPTPSSPAPKKSPAPPPTADAEPAPHHTAQDAHGTAAPASVTVGEASVIGITTAAGLLTALRCWRIHQRRKATSPTGQHALPELSPAVQRAVSTASHAHRSTDPDAPDEPVTRRTPPAQPQHPATVPLGTTPDGEASINLLAHPGGCAWSGPGAEEALRALAIAILSAAERQRPQPPHTRAVLTEDLAQRLLPELPRTFTALTQVPDTAEAIRQAQQHLLAHARHTAEHEDTAHETAPSPGTLLLLTPPDPAHRDSLQALAARSAPASLLVLTLEDQLPTEAAHGLPEAASWHIATNGTVNGPHTGQQLQLFQLTLHAARDILQMLLGAHGRHPRPPTTATPNDSEDSEHHHEPAPPHETHHEVPPQADAKNELPQSPPPLTPEENSGPSEQRKPVRLHLLGPFAVYIKDHPDPVGSRIKGETRELLMLLAAHPTGLLASDIAHHLHLSEDPENLARDMKNIRRSVRRTLRGATGMNHVEFIVRHGEMHKLNPQLIETDLSDIQRTLETATDATGDEYRVAINQALDLYHGPFAAGSDHLWADGIREHLATQLCDAVVRLAHQAEHTDLPRDHDAALSMIERITAHHPDDERLYAAAIRLHQAAGRHDAAQRTYTRLQRHLAQLGVEPDPAVRALVTHKSLSSARR